MTDETRLSPSANRQPGVGEEPPRALTDAAKRALAEAEARRKQRELEPARPAEVGGRAGPDPVRYGDWEKDGIVSDF